MSFDNHCYPHRKDKRKKYYGSKSFDRSCRNHGNCGYCYGNRTFNTDKRKLQSVGDDFIRGGLDVSM